MIQHTVVFSLKHPAGSQEEVDFFEAVRRLRNIPGVTSFQCLRQVSKKNDFSFGLSMEFETEADYQSYNDHPAHLEFLETQWFPGVSDFMEIDYAPY